MKGDVAYGAGPYELKVLRDDLNVMAQQGGFATLTVDEFLGP